MMTNTNTTTLPDVNEASPLTKVRNWLIRKLAGKSVVILNADLAIIANPDLIAASAKGINSALISNNIFRGDPTGVARLHIEQNRVYTATGELFEV